MSLLKCLIGLFRPKIEEKTRRRILTNIKYIRKIFKYPHLNEKERYGYDTLRYLHRLLMDPLIPPDEMFPRDRQIYVDFCKLAIKYSDYVFSNLVSKRKEGDLEELEEKFMKVSNSQFASCSMPFEAYQKLRV